ncbi:response regulator transcription factor [Bacillus thuringiensis]|uniref:Two-component response regulator VanRB n=1 Tax=Bacillus thuringiensis HD-771 TaxID=1218175 RepID=A0A9W3NX64_BACTU|nr:response regulator transcription factor [Bacillus thuringiensis]AFQ15650.1 two-component response regulator VanRB [Bacillus thuringiensis HD-771]MEB4892963.1 response regulator transcription factor [Bacillus thuringiensis]MEC2473205.1 response regulator transcription factor [Bacillus thuringiensis]MEC2564677.1 response regulator transcription factor [Bacillus thuringiensis]MEC2726672.1 response regulator transcription factor [Bacillus thuringiensis]
MRNYHILVVENNPKAQKSIKLSLLKQHYTVETAENGIEGLKLFSEKTFDLVLLDVLMPYLNGFEVAKIIRKQSPVPIIMLTALIDEQNQIRGFNLGIDDYITKPFSYRILISRIQAVLKRSNTRIMENHLIFKEIHLICDIYKVLVDKNEVMLTKTEFEILQILIRNERKVLTRGQILQEIWGYNYYGDTKLVDTHIKNIRRKLKVPYIKTINGIGYKMDN